ncbi:hypothetical protein Bca101_052196 [Brassica carinata]
MPNLEEIQRFSNPISNQPIPISLEKIKDQVNDTPVFSSCLTSLSRIIDTDSQQVFECSSLENTDTENEDSDLDDPMDFEPEVEPNDRERVALDAEHTVGVVKAPKPSYQKYYTENVNQEYRRKQFNLNMPSQRKGKTLF